MNIMRVLILILAVVAMPASASQMMYVPPPSAELNLYLDRQVGNRAEFVAEFTALLGEVRDVKCFFEGSSGIVIEPAEVVIDSLESGRVKIFRFTATISPASSQARRERWVRFRVEYTPDYSELKYHIADNFVEYPDEYSRNRLFGFIDQAHKDGLNASDNVRFFIK